MFIVPVQNIDGHVCYCSYLLRITSFFLLDFKTIVFICHETMENIATYLYCYSFFMAAQVIEFCNLRQVCPERTFKHWIFQYLTKQNKTKQNNNKKAHTNTNTPASDVRHWNSCLSYLLTNAHRSQWSIGHLRPLAIALCSGLLWPFQTSWFQLCFSVSPPVIVRRPLFLFPCGFQVRAWCVVLDACFLRVCPIQPHFLRSIYLATGSCPVPLAPVGLPHHNFCLYHLPVSLLGLECCSGSKSFGCSVCHFLGLAIRGFLLVLQFSLHFHQLIIRDKKGKTTQSRTKQKKQSNYNWNTRNWKPLQLFLSDVKSCMVELLCVIHTVATWACVAWR